MTARNNNAPDAANVGALVQQKPNDTQIKADLSIITSIAPQTLTKQRRLDANGKMITDTVAQMSKGSAVNMSVTSVQQVADILDGLEHSQAVTWGIHTGKQPKATILSSKHYEQQNRPDDALTRTNKHYKWGNHGGVMMLDCDMKTLSKADFIDIIKEVIPLDDTAHIWRPSSSSHIYHGHEQLSGLTGQRLYVFVTDANDIERAGKVLFERLWLNGHGYYDISKVGSYLSRAPIDAAVFQPSRLDFAAGSQCIEPLEQRTVATQCHDGQPLDTKTALPDLTAKEQKQLTTIKEQAKAPYADEVRKIRAAFSHDKAMANLAKQGVTEPTDDQLTTAKNNVLRALNVDVLAGDFIITLADGTQITIGDALDDPDQYHGAITKDPLEPDYNNHSNTGKLYLQGQRPRLFSQAHGGKTYKLMRQPRRIEHVSGKMTDTTLQTLRLMRALPDYFDMGDQLVSIKDGHIMPFNEPLLEHELGAIAQYWQWKTTEKGTYERLIDPPVKVIKQILAMHKRRDLKPLSAVINAPTIAHDDHIVSKQGYDANTQLYLDCLEHGVSVLAQVSEREAIAAYHELMKPFGTFDFADEVNRSVALSAILTAITRPSQATAPAFAFDAPKQGSGKTYFCECLGLLATGHAPAMTPSIEKNEDEVRKTLLAMVIEGRRFIIWDNVMGHFNSATMAAFLTSERFSGRILGASQSVEVAHRAMLLLTGNNITLVGDMPRRVLTCRFDTGIENPTQAKRDLSAIGGLRPAAYIKQNRYTLAAAAITLIRGYLQSNEHNSGGMSKDRLPSFEQWDIVARQPVIWLSKRVAGLTDPKRAIDDTMDKDPEHETLSDLLTHIYAWRPNQAFTAKELCDHAIRHMPIDNELQELLIDLNGGKMLSSRSVGRILKFRHGRIADGLKLSLSKASTKGNSFKVSRIIA
ncbi:hypothetical protein [Psychrobacter celer]|uniref:hypothetical protein n=1 Tax=Psychrobacter celer TaxID=306572 RepID=UPI003FD27ADF